MNKDKFISYMQDPNSLNKTAMDELAYLINQFPYCQSAHILLTLSHFKDNNIQFESSLKTTAIYAANRKILKKHIDRLSSDNSAFIFHDEGIKDNTDTKQRVTQAETPKAEPIVKAKEGPSETKVKEEKTVEENPKKEFEQTIVAEQKKVKIEKPETKVEKKEDVKKQSPPKVEEKKPIVHEEEEIIEKEIKDINKTRSIAELKKIVEKRIREIEKEKRDKNNKSTKPKDLGNKKSELIDTFIKNQPQISRPKTNFFNAKDLAASSIVDQENIVSETLATIYLDQGHMDKAINIYNKLSLKFPEKSAYFAALIKKAEREPDNKK